MKPILILILFSFTQLCFATTEEELEKIQTLLRVGDYQTALELNRSLLAANKNNSLLLNQLGDLEFETGNLDDAEKYFQLVIDLADSNSLTAKLNLARVYLQTGRLQSAETLFVEILNAYRTRQGLSARDLYAIASASRQLGRSDPQLFKQAVLIFGEANLKNPSDLDASIALGELLLEKYNNQEALEVFTEVLDKDGKHPRALLGLARSQHFDYSSNAMFTVLTALEVNPNLVAARVFLSRLYIELEQYAPAQKEAEKALKINPVSLEALSMLAVVYHLERNSTEFDRIEKRVLALNPEYAELYTTLADLAAQNRLYQDAENFSRMAVTLDTKSWKGYGLLGMNQLRLGRMQLGRANLEHSFNGDPYNVWIKNTLQLGDSFKDYVQTEKGQFLIVVHGKENSLFDEYIHDLADSAYAHFKARYQHEPEKPIRLELYPDHADFSVRTVGLAGVGLLGVCFGPVVAMDSPAARDRGEFNWGSTLWHELAHVFHLSMTDNRVPRWFSEGLAVYEEHAAQPGWGGDVSPDFLLAYLEGRLLPLSELNNGFVRPSYPEQVIHSYFQASLVFEFIEARWGFEVIREILNAFKDSKNHNEVLLGGLKLDKKSLDAAFDTFLKNKYSAALQALSRVEEPEQSSTQTINPDQPVPQTAIPNRYFQQLEVGSLLYEKGDLVLAEMFLRKAQTLFPEYAGGDSSYWLLASLYAKQGMPEQAEAQLEKMIAINAEHYEAHLQLAKLRAESGDIAGAADALERAIYIYPYDIQLHQDLAQHQANLGIWDKVARERRALLALDPVDKAEAYYQLAYAYDRAGNRSSAHEQILYALEIAPNFYRAQALLLSLIDTQPSGTEKQ
jgi:tetratricopeptide (TPR) repeat protein